MNSHQIQIDTRSDMRRARHPPTSNIIILITMATPKRIRTEEEIVNVNTAEKKTPRFSSFKDFQEAAKVFVRDTILRREEEVLRAMVKATNVGPGDLDIKLRQGAGLISTDFTVTRKQHEFPKDQIHLSFSIEFNGELGSSQDAIGLMYKLKKDNERE